MGLSSLPWPNNIRTEADAYEFLEELAAGDRRVWGGATVKTIALLTPEQVDEAANRSVDYREVVPNAVEFEGRSSIPSRW